MRLIADPFWMERPLGRDRIYTIQGIPSEVIYYPHNRPWTWKPLHRANKRRNILQNKQTKMAEEKRTEAVLRNLASELLTENECHQFKQVLHHFRVSQSVTSLCQQLKPIINNTQKILLLIELSTRMPKNLQEDFHRLCSLQYPSYDTYLKVFSNGNTTNEMPQIVAQDSSGMFKIVSRGSEKKMMVKYNNQKNTYEVQSIPGTSVTSGVYSNASDSEDGDNDNEFDTYDHTDNQGHATSVHLDGHKNVHRVFLNRHEDGSLGLGINGGKEFRKDIIINVVEETGPAATQGLQVGDKILEVNGHTFNDITHAEAVTIMRNAWNLIILIERSNNTDNTIEDEVDDVFTPPPVTHSNQQVQHYQFIVYPSNSSRLGCITQRLHNHHLLVKKIEERSPAAKAGIRTNDHIYKVDNIRVEELSEKQIVMLTRAKRVVLGIKRDLTFTRDTTDHIQRTSDYNGTDSGLNSMDDPPEKQRRMTYRSGVSPRSDRDRSHSAESKQSSHHSTHNSHITKTTQQLHTPPKRPHSSGAILDEPEHLVYGNGTQRHSTRDGNWMLTPKPGHQRPPIREHRYTQRKVAIPTDNVTHSYPIHVRSHSAGRYGYAHVTRDTNRHVGSGVSRYVRNRSTSPHRNAVTVSKIHRDDNVIRAIQMGLEKRQRAIRLSLHQMPDPVDYEWEI